MGWEERYYSLTEKMEKGVAVSEDEIKAVLAAAPEDARPKCAEAIALLENLSKPRRYSKAAAYVKQKG
jgi:hypothetical protein